VGVCNKKEEVVLWVFWGGTSVHQFRTGTNVLMIGPILRRGKEGTNDRLLGDSRGGAKGENPQENVQQTSI